MFVIFKFVKINVKNTPCICQKIEILFILSLHLHTTKQQSILNYLIMNSVNVSVNENTNIEIINDTLVIDNKPVKLNGQNLKYMIFGYSLVQLLHEHEIIDDDIRQNIFERLPIVTDDVQRQIDFLQINFLSKDVSKALAKKYKNEIKANFKNKNKKNKVKPVKINKKKSKEVDTNPLDSIVGTTTHLTPTSGGTTLGGTTLGGTTLGGTTLGGTTLGGTTLGGTTFPLTPSSSEDNEHTKVDEKKPKRKYTKKTKNTEPTVEPVTITEPITVEPVTITEPITVEPVTITKPITTTEPITETVTTTEPITVEPVTITDPKKKTTKKNTKTDATKDAKKDAPKNAKKDTKNNTKKDAPKDTTEDAPKDTTEDAPKDTTEDAPKDTTEDAPEEGGKGNYVPPTDDDVEARLININGTDYYIDSNNLLYDAFANYIGQFDTINNSIILV